MDVYATQTWLPHERPMLPGSPSTPHHPAPRRLAYLLVGFIVALTGGLGNALVTVNLPYCKVHWASMRRKSPGCRPPT